MHIPNRFQENDPQKLLLIMKHNAFQYIITFSRETAQWRVNTASTFSKKTTL